MPRSPRQVAVADHLWDTFARMAEETGSDRDALVNQAMHVFACMNGYLAPGSATASPVLPQKTVAQRVLETAARLERDIAAQPLHGTVAGRLRLARDDGSAREVKKARYLIGRGAHCDLVIDSAKISREHAVVVREPDGWWIEDLGSSNGTWFRGERISRRQIADGDEYFLCSERVRCELH